jgi:ParB family chromosome partitioning protein
MQSQMAILLLPVNTLQADPKNPRKVADCEELRLELRLLGQDMKKRGVLVPLLVRRNVDLYVVIDGHRRREAALLIGIDTLPCIVFENDVTEAQIREAQLVTQLHSQALSPYEVYCGAKNWLSLHPGSTAKDLASAINRSEAFVSMVLSLDKCLPEVKQAAAERRISFKDWAAISQADDQLALLAAKLNGASSDQLKRLRKSGGEQESVKVTRIKCEVPGRKASLTIAGKDISLSLACDIVTDWLREAKKAAEQGLSAKSFERVCKDRAGG